MSRLSRITPLGTLIGPYYRVPVDGMGVGGGGGSGPLSSWNTEKANLLKRFFTLILLCFKRGEILAWQFPEKLGKKISDRIGRQVKMEAERVHEAVFSLPESGKMPSMAVLEAVAQVPLKDKERILREVGKLTEEQRIDMLRPETRFVFLQDTFDRVDNQWLDKIGENILAYYAYQHNFFTFLLLDQFKGSRQLELGCQVVEVLIKLGQSFKAFALLLSLLENAAPHECIARDRSHQRNFLLEILPALEKLVPEIRTEEGLKLIIKRYGELDSTLQVEDMLVAAGFMYPKEIVEKTADSADLKVALLLRLGHTLFEMYQDRSTALSKFIEFWKRAKKEIREVGVLVVLIPEIYKQLKGSGLVPDGLLEELKLRGEIDEHKWLPKLPPLPALPPKIEVKFKPTEAVTDPAVLSLRDKVRDSGKQLLFTRNIDLKEFEDIAGAGKMRINGHFIKYFRYGLGHEYGEEGAVIAVVMKPGFWEAEKEKSTLSNPWLREINGKEISPQIKALNPEAKTSERLVYMDFSIEKPEEKERILKDLAREADYNRNLSQKPSNDPDLPGAPARTIVTSNQEGYMGLYPQLEVVHDVPLDQVENILVPEHMWDEVSRIAQQNPEISKLLCKVEGTGKTKEEFMAGRERMGRRSRNQGGSIQPNFGYDSFHLFEQAYFRAVLGEEKAQSGDFLSQARELMKKHGYVGMPYAGWLYASPAGDAHLPRESNRDWKIFVNPRKEKLLDVMETVISVLDKKKMGIQFKVPADLSLEWRPGRKFGDASNTPKIVIYVNEQTLPVIMRALDAALKQAHSSAGFGSQNGPSFARRYGETDLLFYKMEYFAGNMGDERAVVADQAEAKARAAGITDPEKILELKRNALIAAGFNGENFYRRAEDKDPMDRITPVRVKIVG